MIYLDTNIFLYTADKAATHHIASKEFLTYCVNEKIEITTSTETMQEIIHYLKNRNMVKQAVGICYDIFKIIPIPLAIDLSVLEAFLKIVDTYGSSKKLQSRDLLHLATCIENHIDMIITYDKGLKKFKEIRAKTPEEFLKKRSF